MRNKKTFVSFVLVGVTAVAVLWGQSEWKVRQLSQPQAHLNARPVPPQLRAAWPAQNQQLAQLWLARQERDVTPELLVLLKSSQHPDIRRRTVRALGRLEKSATLAPLQTWQKTLTPAEQEALSPTLPLAIGRIQSHDLTGQKKLDAVAKSVGLSWGEIVRLSQKVNAPKAYAQGTPADQIVDEIVDVLYSMGRKEQDTKALSEDLSLSSAQSILVKVGNLPVERQANALIDYISQKVEVEGNDDSDLAYKYLLALPDSSRFLLMWLQDFHIRPQFYIKRHKSELPRIGYGLLLRATSYIQDKQVLPLLLEIKSDFEPAWRKNSNPNSSVEAGVYFFAAQASIRAAQQRKKYQAPPFP